jgi:hypothetical protein
MATYYRYTLASGGQLKAFVGFTVPPNATALSNIQAWAAPYDTTWNETLTPATAISLTNCLLTTALPGGLTWNLPPT